MCWPCSDAVQSLSLYRAAAANRRRSKRGFDEISIDRQPHEACTSAMVAWPPHRHRSVLCSSSKSFYSTSRRSRHDQPRCRQLLLSVPWWAQRHWWRRQSTTSTCRRPTQAPRLPRPRRSRSPSSGCPTSSSQSCCCLSSRCRFCAFTASADSRIDVVKRSSVTNSNISTTCGFCRRPTGLSQTAVRPAACRNSTVYSCSTRRSCRKTTTTRWRPRGLEEQSTVAARLAALAAVDDRSFLRSTATAAWWTCAATRTSGLTRSGWYRTPTVPAVMTWAW